VAATVNIKRMTGSGPTINPASGSLAATRLNTADVVSDGTANPTQIPGSGTNYSFWCALRLVCAVAPATGINHLNFYMDGSTNFNTGEGLNISTAPGTNGQDTTNYTQASGTAGVTGIVVSSGNYPNSTTPANAFGYTSAAPLSINGTFTTGTDTAADNATGCFGDWMILQLTVGTTATVTGVVGPKTMTITWDEF
jgi:hypothetical protein